MIFVGSAGGPTLGMRIRGILARRRGGQFKLDRVESLARELQATLEEEKRAHGSLRWQLEQRSLASYHQYPVQDWDLRHYQSFVQGLHPPMATFWLGQAGQRVFFDTVRAFRGDEEGFQLTRMLSPLLTPLDTFTEELTSAVLAFDGESTSVSVERLTFRQKLELGREKRRQSGKPFDKFTMSDELEQLAAQVRQSFLPIINGSA